jgi:hypothetical protein
MADSSPYANPGATPTRASVQATSRSGRRIFQHPWRIAIVAVAVLVVLNLGVILLNESDTTPGGTEALPADIQSISPGEGQLAGPRDTVSVDLADQYSGVLVIDGTEIPEDQVERVVSLQTISFRPGPGKVFSKFGAGDNTVVVQYWSGRLQDRPDKPFSFSWRFRVSA